MTGTAQERVVDALRAAIEAGEYPPGEALPSGEVLAEKYGVHRGTAQKAVRQLAAEGYVALARRKKPVVRERPRHLTVVRDRNVYRDEIGYYFDQNAKDWRPLEKPTRGIAVPPEHVADLLRVPRGQDVFTRNRLMGPADAQVAAQVATSYIPMALVGELPALGSEKPGAGGIYDRLEDYFDAPLEWHETVSARLPNAEEQAALRVPAGSPVLVVTRTASIRRGDEVIVAEVNETRMAAAQFAVSYSVHRDESAAWPRGEEVA
ncbi:GntR family transcriptional regulator [Streptomyces longwoodensis]|uniref:GntR family transcriptional regulator n=1 Tax=Streptomyces longwoodensis TaxID=68231 RepID=UPI00224D415B|nr:GntR family transcriptional regulator [Streptomyces longwoodensis]MCX5001016.1 GntR family transcriptional regulator [Streptomyces longwoodensis]